eukprot:PLAT15375.1.p1 GENE.PLAT15375.1~~PLAT15375.1.p1  ORF type:complete len:500 (-),score=271.44 PLAT15375.1:104-1603(-)
MDLDDGSRARALIEASKRGDLAGVKKLLKDRVSPWAKDGKGWTPLLWASCNGHVDVTDLLLRHGAAKQYLVEEEGKDDGARPLPRRINSPLHWAAYKGFYDIARSLLRAGLSPHDVDRCGNNAIHLASTGGHADVLTLLLGMGADLTVRNLYGNTALDLATSTETRRMLEAAVAQTCCGTCEREFTVSTWRYLCVCSGRCFCEDCSVVEEVIPGKPMRYSHPCIALVHELHERLTEGMAAEGEKCSEDDITQLEEVIGEAGGSGADPALVSQAKAALQRMRATVKLRKSMESVMAARPLKRHAALNPLRTALTAARELDIDGDLLVHASSLVKSAAAEVRLAGAMAICKTIESASDSHLGSMRRLREAIELMEGLACDERLLQEAKVTQSRLQAELLLRKALKEPRVEGGIFYHESGDTAPSLVISLQMRVDALAAALESAVGEMGASEELIDEATREKKRLFQELKEESAAEEERKRLEDEARLKAERKRRKKKKKRR